MNVCATSEGQVRLSQRVTVDDRPSHSQPESNGQPDGQVCPDEPRINGRRHGWRQHLAGAPEEVPELGIRSNTVTSKRKLENYPSQSSDEAFECKGASPCCLSSRVIFKPDVEGHREAIYERFNEHLSQRVAPVKFGGPLYDAAGLARED